MSWQEGLDSLEEYIDWINSSKLIITQDSLGMHLAMALEKKQIALFGATGFEEVYSYGETIFMKSDMVCDIMPCYKMTCEKDRFCMDEMNIPQVIKEVKGLL